MDHFVEPIRLLAAVGFTGLLVMLRLEADRFGAAEYADQDRYGQRPPLRRRLAWYLLGMALIVAIWLIVPDPQSQLYLRLGDRGAALAFGLAYGALGVAQALGFAWLRYRHLRLPAVTSYPVALLNSIGTAFVDEACFRGVILGFMILIGIDPLPVIAIQAIGYALATRLGAPGRNHYMLLLSLAIGLVSGYVTLKTDGIGAAFLGHSITRFATFVATGHAGQPAPMGREDEEIARKRRPPDGWATVGSRQGDPTGPPP